MLFANYKTPQLTPQPTPQHQKTNEKCREKLPPPCTKSPPFWLPFNHRLNTIQTPIKRHSAHRRAAPSQTPITRPMGGEVQPKTPVLHLSVAPHTPQFPILSHSRAFSFLCPPIYHPTRQESPQTKKATKSSHLATFRRSQFNQIQPHVVQSSPRIKRSTEQN